MNNQQDERLKITMRATWVSVWVNIALTLLQIVVGFLSNSQALLAHGLHSFSDLLSDFLVIGAARSASQSADQNHPYGHARFETAATLILGLSLCGIAFWIVKDSFSFLFQKENLEKVGWEALFAAVLTVIFKESLFHYLKKVAEELNSALLLANALHTRADSVSALVVVFGIVGNFLGFLFLDSLAALVMGGMILHMGGKLFWEALLELTDQGLPPQRVLKIKKLLEESGGVICVHDLKTRRMGQNVLVEAHLEVSPEMSVTEGHRIAESARLNVLKAENDVAEVLVHIDPQCGKKNPDLAWQNFPQRQELLAILQPVLANSHIKIFPHYVEEFSILVLFPPQFPNPLEAQQRMQKLLKENNIKARLHSFLPVEEGFKS